MEYVNNSTFYLFGLVVRLRRKKLISHENLNEVVDFFVLEKITSFSAQGEINRKGKSMEERSCTIIKKIIFWLFFFSDIIVFSNQEN